jgi:hypothetical protein
VQIYYSERLWVPTAWWVVGMFFPVSFVSAVGLYAGPTVALIASVVTAAGVAAALLAYGSVRVRVDAAGLHAGAAVLDWDAAGDAIAHDRSATESRLGPDADHSAWLFVRGYVPESVEVAVADPEDPHPYWLVSTRHPADLLDAIERVRASRTAEPGITAN